MADDDDNDSDRRNDDNHKNGDDGMRLNHMSMTTPAEPQGASLTGSSRQCRHLRRESPVATKGMHERQQQAK